MDIYDFKFIWRTTMLTARLIVLVPVTIFVGVAEVILKELWNSIN